MNTTATSHDAISARPTTQKMPPAYSPELDLAKPTGRKPAAVTSVPVSIGNAVEVQAKVAARARSQPCSIFTTIISIAMMASSTSSPSAMISAPSVMRCRSRPHAYITTNTIASTSGTDSATTMPVRQPSERKLTTSTIASASAKLRRNSETEWSTICGWSAICVISMPTGSSNVIARMAFFRFSPSVTMLAPSCIETPSPSAGLPPVRMRKLGGSS